MGIKIGEPSAPGENCRIIEGKIIQGAAEPSRPLASMILPAMILPVGLSAGPIAKRFTQQTK